MLLSIQALLSAPNPDDPLANDVAEQWKKNESHAIETGEDYIHVFVRQPLKHSGSAAQNSIATVPGGHIFPVSVTTVW